jgi:hypothetical protein
MFRAPGRRPTFGASKFVLEINTVMKNQQVKGLLQRNGYSTQDTVQSMTTIFELKS